MFATQVIGLGLLFLFLELLLTLLLLLSLPCFVGSSLLSGDVPVLDIVVIVGPPACGTQSIKVRLDVMIAELTDLMGLR